MQIVFERPYLGHTPGDIYDANPHEAREAIKAGVARAASPDDIARANDLRQIKAVHGAVQRIGALDRVGRSTPAPDGFVRFLKAIYKRDDKLLEKEFGSHLVTWKAAMGEASGVTGGYTVPPEWTYAAMKIVTENQILRPLAFVQPMSSATLNLPVPDITSVPPSAASPF